MMNSILELNHEAMDQAEKLDHERSRNGSQGTLHGISILLKDNIALTG